MNPGLFAFYMGLSDWCLRCGDTEQAALYLLLAERYTSAGMVKWLSRKLQEAGML